MSVRDRGRAAEIAEIQKQIDAGTLVEQKYITGAGSSIGGQIGRPENMPTDARGRMAHRARREFVEEREIRPAAEALAKAVAIDNDRIVASHEQLSQLINSKVNLDAAWLAETGDKSGHPLLKVFTRGLNDASSYEADAFFAQGGPFHGFLSADIFKKYRHTSVEQSVLEIIFQWAQLQNISVCDAHNLQRVLALMETAGYVLPDPPAVARRVEPTVAERIQYTTRDGRKLTGKQAIAEMPSEELKRRLKEPGFASLVEETETGRPLSAAVMHSETRPYDYTTAIVLHGFPMKSGIGANERVELIDLTAEMLDRLPAEAYRQAVLRITGKPFLSVADAIKKNDGLLDDAREVYRRIYGR